MTDDLILYNSRSYKLSRKNGRIMESEISMKKELNLLCNKYVVVPIIFYLLYSGTYILFNQSKNVIKILLQKRGYTVKMLSKFY
jgi:hypothetical protein